MPKSIHLLGLRRTSTKNKQKRACLFLVNKHNYFGYNSTRLGDGDMPVRSNESLGRVQMPDSRLLERPPGALCGQSKRVWRVHRWQVVEADCLCSTVTQQQMCTPAYGSLACQYLPAVSHDGVAIDHTCSTAACHRIANCDPVYPQAKMSCSVWSCFVWTHNSRELCWVAYGSWAHLSSHTLWCTYILSRIRSQDRKLRSCTHHDQRIYSRSRQLRECDGTAPANMPNSQSRLRSFVFAHIEDMNAAEACHRIVVCDPAPNYPIYDNHIGITRSHRDGFWGPLKWACITLEVCHSLLSTTCLMNVGYST